MLTPPPTPRATPEPGARDAPIDVDALYDDEPEIISIHRATVPLHSFHEREKMDDWPLFTVPNLEAVDYKPVDPEFILPHAPKLAAQPRIPVGLHISVPSSPAYRGHVVTTDALDRIASRRWASDESVASAIGVLCDMYTTRLDMIFIMSTWEMAQWTYLRKSPAKLYDRWKKQKPWSKEIIIFPVVRHSHWTLVVVWPRFGHAEFFDSLGCADRELICRATVALVRAVWVFARDRGEDCPELPLAWTHGVILESPIQQNHDDCGIWIIAQVEAMLRGYKTFAWRHAEMANYRRCLASAVIAKRVGSPVLDSNRVSVSS
ncbi:cysteine proteinase [Auricularia subglabra TFB-10046 SS5]|uniref:Cysteine proteinase n=1 Tax=Auricularia subglabra (strain TFB-10046 / SS5) TaxID=717982 RepID=J0CUS7_AURST|nr:cysteine proteinase [Auricularia subglabra TFB-10046 SS5]